MIQCRAGGQVYFVPLGTFFQPMAYNKKLSGIVEVAIPVFWTSRRRAKRCRHQTESQQ